MWEAPSAEDFDFGSSEATLEEMQRQIAAYAEANPEREWIFGGMWPKGVFPGENAMREDLDAVVPDRPTCLMDQGGHAYYADRKLSSGGVGNDTRRNLTSPRRVAPPRQYADQFEAYTEGAARGRE